MCSECSADAPSKLNNSSFTFYSSFCCSQRQQRLVAILNLVGFWVIGTVVGASLCFAGGLGVAGLWWGLAIGLTATATVGLGCLSQTNFKHEAHLATQRIQSSSQEGAKREDEKQTKDGSMPGRDEEKGEDNPLDNSSQLGATL